MAQSEKTSEQGSRLLIDAGPIGVWILVFNLARQFTPDDAIYWGTGAYMIAATAALIASVRIEKRIPPMLVFTTVIVLAFGAMGIFLQDPIFIYVKPTIINLFLSAMILGALALGWNVWKIFFEHIFHLPDHAWTMLAIRWALWFQFLAFLNELMWRHINDTVVPESARWFADLEISEAFWANAKLGVMVLSVLFAMLQMPLVMKYQKTNDTPADA